jgi:hypothetical protein
LDKAAQCWRDAPHSFNLKSEIANLISDIVNLKSKIWTRFLAVKSEIALLRPPEADYGGQANLEWQIYFAPLGLWLWIISYLALRARL